MKKILLFLLLAVAVQAQVYVTRDSVDAKLKKNFASYSVYTGTTGEADIIPYMAEGDGTTYKLEVAKMPISTAVSGSQTTQDAMIATKLTSSDYTYLVSELLELKRRVDASEPLNPKPPTNITYSAVTSSGFRLDWDLPAGSYDSIVVKYKLSSVNTYTSVWADSADTAYVFTGLSSGLIYNIYLQSVYGGLLSASSTPISVTTGTVALLIFTSPCNFGNVDSTSASTIGWRKIWDAETQTSDVTWDESSTSATNYRNRINNAFIDYNADTIRVVFNMHSTSAENIVSTYIGERSGATGFYTGTPTKITWNTGVDSSGSITGIDTTDSMVFTIDKTKDYLIHWYALSTVYYTNLVGSGATSYKGTGLDSSSVVSYYGAVDSRLWNVHSILGNYSTGASAVDTFYVPLITNSTIIIDSVSGLGGIFSTYFTLDTISVGEDFSIPIVIDRYTAGGTYSDTAVIHTEYATQYLILTVNIIGLDGTGDPPVTANYYVDQTSGSDANNGLTTSTAWKTINKINSTNLPAGTIVALKRGELWRESLSLASTGGGNSVAGYIKITAYGTGNKPKIIGSISELTGWADRGSNIWKKYSIVNPPMITFAKSGIDNFGYAQTSIANCNSDYEHYWIADTLYVYATSNPNGYYSAIERHSLASGAMFSADYIWIDNIEFAYATNRGIRTNQADYVKITNCKIHHISANGFNNTGEGIYHLSSNGLIANNEIYEIGAHGIYVGSYSPYVNLYNTIEYNRFYNCYHTKIDLMNVNMPYSGHHIVRYNTVFDLSAQGGGAVVPDYGSIGIQVMGVTNESWCNDVYIYGNVIYDNATQGINLPQYSDSIFVFNNTIYSNEKQGIYMGDATAQSHPQRIWVYNNISTSNGYPDIQMADATNKVINYNLYYSDVWGYFAQVGSNYYSTLSAWQAATPFDDNSYVADPLFVNTSIFDFTLQSGSPAKNTGTNLVNSSPYFYTKDIDSNAVPTTTITDIGAYEFQP